MDLALRAFNRFAATIRLVIGDDPLFTKLWLREDVMSTAQMLIAQAGPWIARRVGSDSVY